MKKLITLLLLISFAVTVTAQSVRLEQSPNVGYFMLDSIDYVKGNYTLEYEGNMSVDSLRLFSLKNIYTGEYLLNSRYYTKITGVTSWSALSKKIEEVGAINTKHTDKPFYQLVSEGGVPGYDTEFKFGENTEVGTTEEVIWDAGGSYTFLTAAKQLDVVSDAANDSLGGSGANTIIIYGLDSLYNEINETLELKGLTTVTTSESFLRVYRAKILTSGTLSPTADANEGTITIATDSDAVLQAQINPRNGQTLMCVYTVPAGKTAYISGVAFCVGKGKECVFKVKFRNGVNGAFSVKYVASLYQSPYFYNLKVPQRVDEKIDIVITGKSAADTNADASFGLLLKDN